MKHVFKEKHSSVSVCSEQGRWVGILYILTSRKYAYWFNIFLYNRNDADAGQYSNELSYSIKSYTEKSLVILHGIRS